MFVDFHVDIIIVVEVVSMLILAFSLMHCC